MATEKSVEKTVEKTAAPKKSMVRIKLYKDDNKFMDDLFVKVNSKHYQIQRGVEVDVPYEVAEVLRRSAEQDFLTMQLIERMQEKA